MAREKKLGSKPLSDLAPETRLALPLDLHHLMITGGISPATLLVAGIAPAILYYALEAGP